MGVLMINFLRANVNEHVNVDVAAGLNEIVFVVVQADLNVKMNTNTNTHFECAHCS